ncbi:MAG: PadR family transcriptional regulator [Phormidesmis sp.]
MSLSYAILAALFNQPCSGYDLVKSFNKSVEYFWSASHQQIYKALAKLEEEGDVSAEKIEQENRPNKKLYTVTESGRQNLQQWIAQTEEIVPVKSNLLVKLSIGHMVPTETLLTTLTTYYQQHREKLKSYRAVAKQYAQVPQLSRESQFQYLALRAGIRQQLAWVAWCEEAMGFLGQPVNPSAGKSVGQSLGQSLSQSTSQSTGQSVTQPMVARESSQEPPADLPTEPPEDSSNDSSSA